jgi:molecular chaperone GrpE (heat shock protein)
MTTKQELEIVKEQLAQTNHKLNRVLFLLEDDSTTNTQGFISKLNSIDKTLSEILTREKVYRGKATVWGMVGASLISLLFFIGKQILSITTH